MTAQRASRKAALGKNKKQSKQKAGRSTRKKPGRKTSASVAQRHAEMGLLNYQHPDRFGQWLGYEIHRLDYKNRIAQARLELREDHLSPAGRVHGGVISGFFDYACGAAVFLTLSPKDFCSTVELKVNYLKPLNVGDRLLAEVRVVYRGKRLCVVQGFMYRTHLAGKRVKESGGGNETVAMASATFNIVSSNSTRKHQKGA